MNTRYSNNGDKLENFYREKFEDFSCEPFPDAFEKINNNLSTETSIFSKLNQSIIDKFGAKRILTSLQVSLLINFIAIVILFNNYIGEKETVKGNVMHNEKSLLNEDVQTSSHMKKNEGSNKIEEIKPTGKKETSSIINKKEKEKENKTNLNHPHVGISKEELKKTLIPSEEENKGHANILKIDSLGPTLNNDADEEAKKQNYKDNLEQFYNQHAEKLKDSTNHLFKKK